MGVKTLYEYFYKLAYGDKGADKATLVSDCLDVADAEIKANKDLRHSQGSDYSNIVICTNYDHPDDAITAIGATKATLLVTESETCDLNFTVPANVTVKFERGGKWTINTGITVTFNGQIDAGLWQIFEYVTTGTLTFGIGAVEKVYPQWWGAIANGTTDCSPAIVNAILSLPSTGGTVYLVAGTYRCNSSITFPIDTGYIKNVKIQGESSGLASGAVDNPYGTRINSYIAGGMLFDLFTDSPTCANVEFRDFECYDVEATGVNYGIKAYNFQNGCIIENIGFKYFTTSVYISHYCYYAKFDRLASYYARDNGMYFSTANGILLNRITSSNSTGNGLQILSGVNTTIQNSYFENNTERGVEWTAGSGYIQAYFEGNTDFDLVLGSSVKMLTVESSYFNIGAGSRAIYTDAEQLISIGNYFNTGAYGIYRNAGVACDFGSTFVGITTDNTFGCKEVDLTEFGYLEGVTSAIQTQLNAKPSYSEDTWTPVLTFGGASVGMTYATQSGLYTKIGRQVTVTCCVILSAKGTSTGNALITGLPFTCKNDNGASPAVSMRLNVVTFANQYQGSIGVNTTNVYFEEITEAGVETYLNDTNFANTSVIVLSATYFTD